MAFTFPSLTKPILGELCIPGDKSISHRAIMLGSLAKGKTQIDNFLDGEDCLHTIEIFKQMGVKIKQSNTNVTIESEGFHAFTEPLEPLYFGNSGTTARLMLGILCNLPFHTVLHGDPHLTIRPMDRVVTPLRKMGAKIDGRQGGSYLPLAIRGERMQGITYDIPVKSAQVKSAILLAGLFAEGETRIRELAKTRDHTENILAAFGVDIMVDGNEVTVSNKGGLSPVDVTVPGDISSAAFFLVAASIVPDSKLTLLNVGLNKTRTGIIDVLQDMGAQLTISNERMSAGEPIGDITVAYSELHSTEISGDLIPRLIDEIPIIALLATQAHGNTVIKNAEELRVKETDRIKAVVEVLTTLGANVEEKEDGMIIYGKSSLTGGSIKSYADHRMAMLAAIASLIAKDKVVIDDISSIAVSYPTFFEHLEKITNIAYTE
ncbi:MAG TPA: 3-phosphoshikimate 1-carboxyvinyltransferase [Pseudogracilibacillus sp.]|nr:3-phosphoshikimate 1-carboxyvinyltransferase [Pseudogracilibacillus sp.]